MDPIHGGRRFSVALSPGENSLFIKVQSGTKTINRSLRIGQVEQAEILLKSLEMRDDGKHEEATKLLTDNLESFSPHDKNRSLSLLARLALYQNQIDKSIEWFHKAIHSHQKSGCISAAALEMIF